MNSGSAEGLTKIGYTEIKTVLAGYCCSPVSSSFAGTVEPEVSEAIVSARLSETSEMMRLLRNPEVLPFDDLPDINPHLKTAKPQGGILPLHAFPELLFVIRTVRLVHSFFKKRAEEYPMLFSISRELVPLPQAEKELSDKLTETGGLRDDASSELLEIRKKLRRRQNELRTSVQKLFAQYSKLSYASDEGPTIRGGRMVIPILAEYKRKVQGFVHDVSATGQTVYIEPAETLHLNNEIRQFELAEFHEIERILKEMTTHIRIHSPAIGQNVGMLIRIDIIRAKARLSNSWGGEIPVLSSDSEIFLKQAKNPALLLKFSREKNPEKKQPVIPLNLHLEPEERCLMITGPNAGGKSVAIKTVALCSMLLQSGIGIPASASSRLPVFSSLYVNLGDDQSIENDLSTFSSRLVWMKKTLETAESKSLILIDEAGSGTDPEEGGAIFQAFIEELLDRKCTLLVTTHHGSLKVFAHEHPRAINASMEFDHLNLMPTYQFVKGTPGSSYAFEIAERLQLKPEMISRARTLLGKRKNSMENLILELQEQKRVAENERKAYEDLKRKAEKEYQIFKDKKDSIDRQKEQIMEKALVEAKRTMDSANRRIEEAVAQISGLSKDEKNKIKEIRSEVAKKKSEIQKEISSGKKSKSVKQSVGKPPKPGDYVRFTDSETTGELIQIDGKRAVVMVGSIRLKTKLENLEKTKIPRKQKDASAARAYTALYQQQDAVKPVLDVRGKRADEALKEVHAYIDGAYFRGLLQVEIIHGKGEGILKDVIHKAMKGRPEIEKFTFAHADSGGEGSTIVQFKNSKS